ncbi:Tyrosineprotein kinase PR2like, partial [Caligus rogercresseyi]
VSNKNPKMVFATGYLRKSSNADSPSLRSRNPSEKQQQQPQSNHEYQSIEEEGELFSSGPLDLGPSLMDEVFNELDSSLDSAEAEKNERIREIMLEVKKSQMPPPPKKSEDFKDLVISTLSRHKPRSQGKRQQATVKPINAQDEKTLESAIAMANALASKSMHELDKRGTGEDFYEVSSPIHSPLTPNSPSKKFSFWFPGGGKSASSPKSERRIFSEEVRQASGDVESSLSPGAKDAYKALIEGSSNQASSLGTNSHNPLPLPPKSITMSNPPPKRHVRKNPLIINEEESLERYKNTNE